MKQELCDFGKHFQLWQYPDTFIINNKINLECLKILIEKAKQTEIYKNFMENFPDAELVDVKSITKEDKDND